MWKWHTWALKLRHKQSSIVYCCWEAALIKPITSADALTCLKHHIEHHIPYIYWLVFVVCELQCWWSNWMSCLRKKRERKKGKKRETQLLLDSECRDYCISIDSCSAALFCMNSRLRRLNVQQTHHFRRHDAYWAGSECHAAYYFQRQYAVCIMGAECKFY